MSVISGIFWTDALTWWLSKIPNEEHGASSVRWELYNARAGIIMTPSGDHLASGTDARFVFLLANGDESCGRESALHEPSIHCLWPSQRVSYLLAVVFHIRFLTYCVRSILIVFSYFRLRFPVSLEGRGFDSDGVIGIFQWRNSSGRTMALGSTQPLTKMSTRIISWG